MTKFYDRENNPITSDGDEEAVIKWARMYEDNEYRQVKVTALDEKRRAWVSTIWQGFDFYGNDAFPQIFETMQFENDRPVDDPVRHHTEADAIEYHDALVANWK